MVPALEIRALTKRYDDGTVALDALDLTIPDGAFFGLLGPNGAGKTTLINSTTGLVRVTSGSIRVFAHEAVGDHLETLAARSIVGLAPQDVNLDRFLTVYESLLYHGGYYGMPRREAAPRPEEMIGVFDLRAKRGPRPPRPSGGVKRRPLPARALRP